ncbi:MAG: BadF/BadG/BcrA/BcrD ATPase family protein, partial [Bacillota bacterium]|nr:BadF/BadG/BcrA/BcrD ATPase family protein [Bacillota bacterium]
MNTLQYVVGIDGGQTSTKAAIATLQGEVVQRVETTAWDATRSRRGRMKCRAALASIRQQTQDVTVGGEIASVCIGMTGGSYGRDRVTRWARSVFSCRSVTVSQDMVVNLRGADPVHGEGVVVIAGGGSVAWGRTTDGTEATAGGYGHILGDEGSAYEIGRQAIVAALRASQHRTPATALTREVLAHFAVDNVWDARLLVYSGDDPRKQLSALAPRVSSAAETGDGVAQQIVLRAGSELASM